MLDVEALATKKCLPCTGKTPRLTYPQLKEMLPLVPHWQIVRSATRDAALVRFIRFKKFAEAMTFLNKVAAIAESEGHHPDITLENYNQVTLTMLTHSIGSVSENDFIIAAKIDQLLNGS